MTTIKYMTTLLFLTLLSAVTLAGPVNVNAADAETISVELQGEGITKAIGARAVEIDRKNILLDTKVAKSK